MFIIEDTRQKKEKHENKHRYWVGSGTPWIRSGLPFGDYWAAPDVAVDTKQDIKEVAVNLCGNGKERKRFRDECDKAKTAGCMLVFLIEDKHYTDIDDLFGERIWIHDGRIIPGDSIAQEMYSLQERFGVRFRFCSPADAGRMVVEILEEGGDA